ncbi:hypothetical protein NSPZN2_20027 [Nitrospira defluvii]|uniref:Uncharacterized protein n=1 Tax=Nitrospira defluvii TaxID=330214 RepID=A0ABM8RD05_9BACT|nr:hypothetical protein NSPZN2_20027 [Nitrospira defluvii]
MGGEAARIAERADPAPCAEARVAGEDPYECEAREGGIEAEGCGSFHQKEATGSSTFETEVTATYVWHRWLRGKSGCGPDFVERVVEAGVSRV